MKNSIKKIKIGYFYVAFFSALLSLIFYLLITHSFEFGNNIELKDIVTLLFNAIFVIFISKSITKSYDSHRKKKDIYIDELKSYLNLTNRYYLDLKDSQYSKLKAVFSVTELRDETENLKNLIANNFGDGLNGNFDKIQQKLRTTDRIVNPKDSFTDSINNDQATLINSYKLEIRNEIMDAINKINIY